MGFTDPDWEGPFYPRGVRGGEHLPFYARYFDTVELDTTFHAEPTPDRIRRWAAAVPESFRFCVKTPKAITHEPGLEQRAGPMLRFLDTLRSFGPKLGLVLVQFPPSFPASARPSLETFLRAMPTTSRLAIEFRHRSWDTESTADLLRERGVTWVAADYLQEPWEIRRTTDELYFRWIGQHDQFPRHEHEQIDATERLEWWKGRILSRPDPPKVVWGFFNNDYAGYSVGTCNRFKRLVGLEAQEPKPSDRGELFG